MIIQYKCKENYLVTEVKDINAYISVNKNMDVKINIQATGDIIENNSNEPRAKDIQFINTLLAIGEKLNISQIQVSRIQKKALNKLFEIIAGKKHEGKN